MRCFFRRYDAAAFEPSSLLTMLQQELVRGDEEVSLESSMCKPGEGNTPGMRPADLIDGRWEEIEKVPVLGPWILALPQGGGRTSPMSA